MSETGAPYPFFSVVIPTYNRARSIGEAVRSVQAQTFTDWELIVVDDGSTDDTAQVLAPICAADPRVRYIHQQNAERSAARNTGIAAARGSYICFLDSDDVHLPTHLSAIHARILETGSPVAMFYTGSCGVFRGQITPWPDYITKTDDPYERVLKDSICPQRACLHRDIMAIHRFDVSLRINEDRELWSRVVGDFPLIAVPASTAVIRDLGDRTVTADLVRLHQSNLEVLRIIIAHSGNRIKNEWKAFALSATYQKLALAHRDRGQRSHFYWNMLRSIWVMPSHFTRDKILTLIGKGQ
jgi:glycosyltransferase involved in cell wall biosynthesis